VLCAAAGLAVLAWGYRVGAQAPADTVVLESLGPYRFAVTVPSACRHEEGPGTLDTVCSPDLDAAKSAEADAAASLVLSAGAESVPADAGKLPADLALGFSEDNFKAELPEAVCGSADRIRVKIENVKQVLQADRVIYSADVLCSEEKFVGIGDRQAAVQVLVTPGVRYRLMARAPKDEFEQHKALVDAFLSSFRVLPAG
jgi:hypothetical protein